MLKKYRPHIILLLAGFAYSSLALFTKFLTSQEVDPFNQVFWRLIIGCIVTFLVSVFVVKDKLGLDRIELKILIINGVIFSFGFLTWSLAIYLGTPITKALVIVFSYPLSVGILGYFILGEKLGKKNVIAMLVSLLSIYVLLEVWKISSLGDFAIGDIFALLNSVCYAFIIVWASKIRRQTNLAPFKTLFYTLLFGLIAFLTISLLMVVFGIDLYSVGLVINYDFITWLGLIGLGTLGTVIPLALIYFGAKDVSPNVASILLLTELVWVFLFGILIFGETLTISTVLGTVGVIASILLVL